MPAIWLVFCLMLLCPLMATSPRTLVILDGALLGLIPPEELAGAELVLLQPGLDPIAQITAALRGRSGIEVLRLISHGEPGVLLLGEQAITADTLQQRSAEVSGWGTALAPGADLLIDVCDLAANASGRALVDELAPSTGPYPLQTDGGTTAASSAAGFSTSLSNQAPLLSARTTGLLTPSYTEGAAAVAVLPSGGSFSISDSDSTAISAATVRISNGLTTGDLLSVDTSGTPLSASYDATSGSLTVVGQADAATYQALLAKVRFSHSGSAPTAISNQRQLSVSVRDNGGSGLAAQSSAAITLNLNVVG